MKAKDLREKKGEELQVMEAELRRELAEAQFKVKMGSLAQVAKLKQIKKDISRILTIRREKA